MTLPVPARALTEPDLLELSEQFLVIVQFGKSTSKNHPLAVKFARAAEIYRGNGETHLALYAKSAKQAAQASALLQLVTGWKSVLVFAGGALVRNYAYLVGPTVDCYAKSSRFKDSRAYCQTIEPGMAETYGRERMAEQLLCCRRLTGRLRLPTEFIPASVPELIRAAGAEHGCDWCPNFKPEAYSQIGGQRALPPPTASNRRC